jgi:hypothetical protein
MLVVSVAKFTGAESLHLFDEHAVEINKPKVTGTLDEYIAVL